MDLNQLRVPRWNGYFPSVEVIEIHGFADASKLAYGASLYLRMVKPNGDHVSLITAKSKVVKIFVNSTFGTLSCSSIGQTDETLFKNCKLWG